MCFRLEHQILLFYATRDGHARRIAEHIAVHLQRRGISVVPENIEDRTPSAEELECAQLFMLIAAVRFGRHLRPADRLMRIYSQLQSPPPLALVSVNLTARKKEKITAQCNPYLHKWIRHHRLSPVLATAFAGKLDYPSYRWWEREAIRFIMTITGGETDPTAQIEYTSWDAVDQFARKVEEFATSTS